MAKLDPLKVLLGPLAGGTIYDSPAAHLFGIKDPEEVRRLRAAEEAEAEKKAAAAKSGMKPAGGMKRGGTVKKMAKGGSTASKRADGCATKGKTKGRFV
jgi:hypothetical protein